MITCSCNAEIALIYEERIAPRLEAGEKLEHILDDLKINRECCRMKFISFYDIAKNFKV